MHVSSGQRPESKREKIPGLEKSENPEETSDWLSRSGACHVTNCHGHVTNSYVTTIQTSNTQTRKKFDFVLQFYHYY